jgi:hypothetical protein
MNTYRVVWLFTCGVAAAAGAGVALTLSVPTMIALFAGAGVVGGAVALNVTVVWDEAEVPLRETLVFVAKGSLVGGAACVALVGLAALLGAWVLLLVVIVGGCSPYALSLCGRWLGRRADGSDPLPRRDPSACAGLRASPKPSVLEPTPEVRSLSDTGLCEGWRASFSALHEASSHSQRIRIVQVRQAYLDEFERRNPNGLTAWLGSGARAAGNPSRYLTGTGGLCRGPIDWDELIRGQDR